MKRMVLLFHFLLLTILIQDGLAEESFPTTETFALAARHYLFYSPCTSTQSVVTIHFEEMPTFLAPIDQQRAYDKLIIWWPAQTLDDVERQRCRAAFYTVLGEIKSLKSPQELSRSEDVYHLVEALLFHDTRSHPLRKELWGDRVSQYIAVNERLLKEIEALFPDRPKPLGIHIHHIRVGHALLKTPAR